MMGTTHKLSRRAAILLTRRGLRLGLRVNAVQAAGYPRQVVGQSSRRIEFPSPEQGVSSALAAIRLARAGQTRVMIGAIKTSPSALRVGGGAHPHF